MVPLEFLTVVPAPVVASVVGALDPVSPPVAADSATQSTEAGQHLREVVNVHTRSTVVLNSVKDRVGSWAYAVELFRLG